MALNAIKSDLPHLKHSPLRLRFLRTLCNLVIKSKPPEGVYEPQSTKINVSNALPQSISTWTMLVIFHPVTPSNLDRPPAYYHLTLLTNKTIARFL